MLAINCYKENTQELVFPPYLIKEVMGGYVKRSMGINLYFKIENPYGERIQNLFVQGKPIEKDKVYDVVLVTNQGVPAKYGHDRESLDIHAIEALKRYLKRHGTVDAELKGSIIAV